MADELGRGKSICILAVVAGCFAILGPNILYPMLKATIFPPSSDNTNGCCHVLLDRDVNGVKLVSELCDAVFRRSETHRANALNLSLTSRSSRDSNIKYCRTVILDTCGVDIHVLLKDKIQLDPRYKQKLDELRTFNKSLCLKYHFDVTLELLGAPHRVKYNYTASSKYQHRQERLPYTRPNGLHPGLRERSKPPLPDTHRPPLMNPGAQRDREAALPPSVIPGKKPPIPGMRPPIGAGSHMQTAKRGEGGNGSMGLLLPMYTTAIVIFFGYTMMKFISRKTSNSNETYSRDPDFCRVVFNNNSRENDVRENRSPSLEKMNGSLPNEQSPKLGWHEKDIRDVEIDLLRKRLAETEATMERIVKQMNLVSQTLPKPLNEEVNRDILERKTNDFTSANHISSNNENNYSESKIEAELKVNGVDEEAEDETTNEKSCSINEIVEKETTKPMEKEKAVIEVVGMELSERCENGEPWTKPIPVSKLSNHTNSESGRSTPQEIILPTNVPANSRILITDAHTENVAEEPSVILESKVTLNVIAPERLEDASDSENERIDVHETKRTSNNEISHETEEEIEEEEEGEEEEIEEEEVEEVDEEEEEEIEEYEEEVEVEETEEEDVDEEQDLVKELQRNSQTTEI